jgi:hypothetical protein
MLYPSLSELFRGEIAQILQMSDSDFPDVLLFIINEVKKFLV